MKVPMCELCEKAHWAYEDHYTGASAINPDYVREMAAGAMGVHQGPPSQLPRPTVNDRTDISPPTSIGPEPPTVIATVTRSLCNACNKPYNNRGNVCNACRQRAYRERSTK